LLPRLPDWRAARSAAERSALLADVPNLLQVDAATGLPRLGPRFTLDLRQAVPPDFSDLDLDRYLAPSRTLLYAPTRGCYWGQCSFCYYGLTETATASYREIPPAQAATELGQLARRYGVKNFYLSCDVLSPKYALALAEALLEKGIKIRWSSDLKIEKYFTAERCQTLFRAGLRSAAFGIESGSDRILQLMRKGVDRETLTEVNRNFHAAGVATEWMTFTDHPDESVEEALETVRWIEREQDAIDLFLVGRFGLERGSHIAQDPERYGVRRIFYARGDDLRLAAQFQQRRGRRGPQGEEQVERAIAEVARHYELHPYPWAGANSTHHSFLHFLEYGQRVFRSHFQRAQAVNLGRLGTPPVAHIGGLREKPRFRLEHLAEREAEFFGDYLPRALHTTVPAGPGAPDEVVSPHSLADFEAAAREVREVRAGISAWSG
jgi:anaerobic magnesium-protoporphyrin IX monomethyl ester cyclase